MGNRSGKIAGAARLATLCVAIVAALMLAGCGHKLVANAGEHTVKVYPDQATYDKLAKLKSEGGPMGMLGGLGANLAAKQVDDRTPVRIVSSNDEGSEIEVTDGPFKGLKGFVPRQNVD
jgi:transcription antitermination factor NusG